MKKPLPDSLKVAPVPEALRADYLLLEAFNTYLNDLFYRQRNVLSLIFREHPELEKVDTLRQEITFFIEDKSILTPQGKVRFPQILTELGQVWSILEKLLDDELRNDLTLLPKVRLGLAARNGEAPDSSDNR